MVLYSLIPMKMSFRQTILFITVNLLPSRMSKLIFSYPWLMSRNFPNSVVAIERQVVPHLYDTFVLIYFQLRSSRTALFHCLSLSLWRVTFCHSGWSGDFVAVWG